MTFFVDANVVVYSGVRDSPYREPCLEIMAAITHGEADGNDPDHGASLVEDRVGHRPHEPDPAAAVDEAEAAPCEGASHRHCGFAVARVATLARPAKHTDALHRPLGKNAIKRPNPARPAQA